MRAYGLAWIVTLVVMLICDLTWLSTVGAHVYRPRLGALLLDKPALLPAALFYLLYAVGVVVFAVAPSLRVESVGKALLWGALFGFFAYATYDLTNLATVRGWSILVTGLDMGWGAVLTAVAASVASFVAQRV
ncbi:MAG: DUF2177 family protein [Stellaceae bacterium]